MQATAIRPGSSQQSSSWDEVYSSELANFEEIGDEGETWSVRHRTRSPRGCSHPHRFGEDSVEKMVDWALAALPPTDDAPPPFVLEVGAGNGNLLFALCDAGYAPARMCGVDYSADAVRLAQAIAHSRDAQGITFSACDFLVEDVPALEEMSPADESAPTALWDLVLDKGTFDAIALAEWSVDGTAPSDGYPARIARTVKTGGYFLITCASMLVVLHF